MASLNIGRALSFGFEDKEWLAKMAVGVLVLLVGVVFSLFLVGTLVLLLLTGYMVAIVRTVAEGQDQELPHWDNWGQLFKDGLFVGVALLVWHLPTALFSIPSVIPLLLFDQNTGAGMDVLSMLLLLISIVTGCLLLIYLIFYALLTPIIVWQVADKGTLGAAFDVPTMFAILKTHLGDLVVIAVTMLVVSLVASLVGILLCGLGVLVTEVWTTWVQGHLVGQLGRMIREEQAAFSQEGEAL